MDFVSLPELVMALSSAEHKFEPTHSREVGSMISGDINLMSLDGIEDYLLR